MFHRFCLGKLRSPTKSLVSKRSRTRHLDGYRGMAAFVKGFGCRRVASGRPGKEPASESLRRRNPRESDEGLAVYGGLARQELWQGMVLAGSLRAESR